MIYSHNSVESGEACDDLWWNHCTSTPQRSETNGTADRAVRSVTEGTSTILQQSSLDENGGLIPRNASVICISFKTSCRMRNLHTKGALENLLWVNNPFLGRCLNVRSLRKTKQDSVWKIGPPGHLRWKCVVFKLERINFGRRR